MFVHSVDEVCGEHKCSAVDAVVCVVLCVFYACTIVSMCFSGNCFQNNIGYIIQI